MGSFFPSWHIKCFVRSVFVVTFFHFPPPDSFYLMKLKKGLIWSRPVCLIDWLRASSWPWNVKAISFSNLHPSNIFALVGSSSPFSSLSKVPLLLSFSLSFSLYLCLCRFGGVVAQFQISLSLSLKLGGEEGGGLRKNSHKISRRLSYFPCTFQLNVQENP